MSKIYKLNLAFLLLVLGACVVAPYDAGPGPAPGYGYAPGYYGYGPAYPWNTGVDVDIVGGYGHGGYWRGGRGGNWGGGSYRGGVAHGGGRGGGGGGWHR